LETSILSPKEVEAIWLDNVLRWLGVPDFEALIAG
jgi:hypothetical protein